MTDCTHEDGEILWGITVYQTALVKITQVLCTECQSHGTMVEVWDENDLDYHEVSETWHKREHYYNK